MSNVLTYRPLCKVCLWQAYYLHPADINPGDLIDANGRPNTLKTVKQEEFAADADATRKYSVAEDLEITPSATTQKIMQQAKMVFRVENSGFSLWLRVKPVAANNFQPFIPLDAPFKLTFVLRVKNPAFFNFTNIDGNNPLGSVYYFSNLAGNRFANTNYLNTTPPQLSPPQNYASALDRVPFLANNLSVDVSTLQTDFVQFKLTGSLASTEIVFEKAEEEDFLRTCQFVPRELPSGVYERKAFARNGSEIPSLKRTFFWNKGDVPADAFGVVELFHLPGNPTTTYSLLATDQRLLSPVYTLWWQNRSTFWRYLFDTNQSPDAANPACSVKLETPGVANQLLSKTKQPLVNKYRKMLFRKVNSSEEILLPNPAPDRVYPEGADYYSEIHLNKTDFDKIIPGTS
jgi:hypothetical protein